METTFDDALFNDALSAHEAGDLATAITLYETLLVHNASHPEVLTNLGIALCQSGNTSGGIEALERAVSLRENDPVALYNLGYALLETGRCSEARNMLARAERISPDDPEITDAVAQARQGLDDEGTSVLGFFPEVTPTPSAEPHVLITAHPRVPRPAQKDDLACSPLGEPVTHARQRRVRSAQPEHPEWARILERLDALERIFLAHGLAEPARLLQQKRKDLLDPSVLVFIIGEGKFGKSSLINHLLGIKAADVGKLPKTWRVDLYRPAPEEDEFAEITRYPQGAPERLSLAAARQICEDQEPDVLRRVRNASAQGRDTQDAVAFDGQVIQVDWYRTDRMLDQRLTLVDTPGFAQPRGRGAAQADALRRAEGVVFDIDDISEFYYSRSDVVLWALKATKLEDVDTLQHLEQLWSEHKPILGVITHWDRIDEADRPGRLQEAQRRYGKYVTEFVCVECQGEPGPPKEGIARLRDLLQKQADHAAEVKLESARAFCAEQAVFAAEWLQSRGDGLIRNVAEIALYCNAASDALLRMAARTRSLLVQDVEDRVSLSDQTGLLGILKAHDTQEQKQTRLGEYWRISSLNKRLMECQEADGRQLSLQGQRMARARKLQQVVLKSHGASHLRSLQAQIDPPQAADYEVNLSGMKVPSVSGGFRDLLLDVFQGSWIGNVAEFFGGRSLEERQDEATQKATEAVRAVLIEQIHTAVAAFTKTGAEAILAGANSGITRVYPGCDLVSLRQVARLLDEDIPLLHAMTSDKAVPSRFERHYTLWSPVDDTRQVVLGFFYDWFESQQTKVRENISPWGEAALRTHPPYVAYVYACVRSVLAESHQHFRVTQVLSLSGLASRMHPSLNVARLLEAGSWLGAVTASLQTREPFSEGGGFLQEAFPDLPPEAFVHFRLDGLGQVLAERLGKDFFEKSREQFTSAEPIDVITDVAVVRFSVLRRLKTRSFLGVTAGAAILTGLSSLFALWHTGWGHGLPNIVRNVYAAEFHAFLGSLWAAGRAGTAVLLLQYLFFLRDKQRYIVSVITHRAVRALREVCIRAWKDTVDAFTPASVRAAAAEYTLVGMRPLDYARDGLVEKYEADIIKKEADIIKDRPTMTREAVLSQGDKTDG